MKNAALLFLASLFVVTGLTACGSDSQDRQLAKKENRIEDQADKKKDAIDKQAEQQKDKLDAEKKAIDEKADKQKDAIDKQVDAQKDKIDAQKKANDDKGNKDDNKNLPDNMNGKHDSPREKANDGK